MPPTRRTEPLSDDAVRRLAERLMADLGTAHLGRPLQTLGWTFGFDRARRRLGACHIRTRRITLSHALSTALPPADVEDTIRHEIAHALDVATRGRTGHDAVWKAWAVRCGAAPARCYSGPLPTDAEAPYVCLCPACGRARGVRGAVTCFGPQTATSIRDTAQREQC